MIKNFKRPEDGFTKEDRKAAAKKYRDNLAGIQQDIKASQIPIIVLVEGYANAGKGDLINEFIKEMDPRFVSVFVLGAQLDKSAEYPFLHTYYNAIPENGKIVFMDSGWVEETVRDIADGKLHGDKLDKRIKDINDFERQMKNNGYLVIKFFVSIGKDYQQQVQKHLRSDANTEWCVGKEDLLQNDNYPVYEDAYDYVIEQTSGINPWVILDGEHKSELHYDAFKTLNDTITAAITAGKFNGEPYEDNFDMPEIAPSLADADMTACIDEESYRKELKTLQKRLSKLQRMVFRKKIPVVLAYEGWDAAGKGGNIKRIAYPLDPRGFSVYPIASPEPHEKARHFLWRFWNKIPKPGYVAIFDRTWYGRVMVERLEGYCTENDWKRAYNEINEFEKELTDWGAVVLKFWIQIDSETQLERFTLRQNTPEKQWKITDEDWRNRDKWDLYEDAVNEMIAKTSTNYAPWNIIESNDKKYARIKTLRIVCDAMDAAIERKDRK